MTEVTEVHLDEEQSGAETAAPRDVPMEEEVFVPPGQALAAEPPPEDWTAAQVIAHSSQLLRGGLDDMDGDNPEPDWDTGDPEGEGCDQLPPDDEEEEEPPGATGSANTASNRLTRMSCASKPRPSRAPSDLGGVGRGADSSARC